MHKQQVELGWINRPARRQVDESTLHREIEARDHLSHNVWSGRRLDKLGGIDRSEIGRNAKKERSKYRCRPELDVGKTRGSGAKQMMFCMYFAKGCCAQGSACPYLHRLPTEEDEAYHSKDMGADIFAREKRGENEGYRKGAGTLERDNRTVYVNYEGAGSYDLPKIRELLEDNFNMWGPVKRIYIVHLKTIAFVEYEWRSTAEFAKEAMNKQGLKGSSQREILTTRWANEDPNPTTIVAVKRSHMDAFEKAAMAAWEALPEEQKRAKIQQLQMADALKTGRVISDYPSTDGQYLESSDMEQRINIDELQYPDTDAQYNSAAEVSGTVGVNDSLASDGDAWWQTSTSGQYSEQDYARYCEQYYAWYGIEYDPSNPQAHQQDVGVAESNVRCEDGGLDLLQTEAKVGTATGASTSSVGHNSLPADPLSLLAGYGSEDSDD